MAFGDYIKSTVSFMQRGFILIYVLLLLALLSLTAGYVLERSISEQKMSGGLLQAYQRDAELMAGLQEAYQRLTVNLRLTVCYTSRPYTPSPLHQAVSFWQTHPVCRGMLHSKPYEYVIERIADPACATYYRLTSHLPGSSSQAMEAIVMSVKYDMLDDQHSDCFIDQLIQPKLYRRLQFPQWVSWYRTE